MISEIVYRMAKTESRRVNALVLQHLYKVAPDIAQVFERTHICEENEIPNSLSQIVEHYKTAELAKRVEIKTDSVFDEQDDIDSEFFSELEKYYPCTYSAESSSDSENLEYWTYSNVKREPKPVENKTETKPGENKTKTKPEENKTKQASVNKKLSISIRMIL